MLCDLHPETEVLVLSESGEKIGTMKVRLARELARRDGLDLVVMSMNENSVVCKIMDESKWRYQQKKRQKQHQRKPPQLKEIKFGVSTQQRDIDIKTKHIHEFLEKGSTVKITIEMHGREKAYSEIAKNRLAAIISSLGDAVVQGTIKATPNCVYTMLQPSRVKNGEGNQTEGSGQ